MYSDAPFEFEENLPVISKYADELREAAFEALDEEAVLIVTMKVYHAVASWIVEQRSRAASSGYVHVSENRSHRRATALRNAMSFNLDYRHGDISQTYGFRLLANRCETILSTARS